MIKIRIKEKIICLFAVLAFLPLEVFAADSYRWLRVSPETPWYIFVFLLPMVLIPIVIMAILHWRYAGKSEKEREEYGYVKARDKKLAPKAEPSWGKR